MKPFLFFGRAAYVLAFTAMGAALAFFAVPAIDGWLFPVFVNVYQVPFDPARPTVMVDRQLDRLCWRFHVYKARDVVTMWRSIVFVEPNGNRHFVAPLDPRTGLQFSNKDSSRVGDDRDVGVCAWVPNDINTTDGLTIENLGIYWPVHGLWNLTYTYPPIVVLPGSEDK